MTLGNAAWWGMLEERSPMVFLLAGLLWLADTTLLSIELFTGISILGTPGPVNPLLYISGLVAAIVGLLGFYPALARRSPRVAGVSAALLGIAGVAITVILVWFVVVTLLNRPDPPGALLFLGIFVAAVGFILIGIASIRSGIPSGTVGLLVLAIPATLIGSIILVFGIYGGNSPDWTSPATGVVISVLLLAIWYLLQSGPWPVESLET